jgi:heat shock protein HslJ
VPDDPVIYSFSVSPNQIQARDCVNIAWSVGGGATYVNILRDGDVIVNDAGFDGQQQDCLDQPGDYKYKLKAGNVAKEVASDPQMVSVNEAPLQNPLAGTNWRVISLYDGAVPIMEDAPPTVSFSPDGRVDGSAGCSAYSASYQAEGDVISIWGVNSSMLDCSDYPDLDALMAQDAAFLEALPMATNFQLDGNRLAIFGPGGQVLMQLDLLLR